MATSSKLDRTEHHIALLAPEFQDSAFSLIYHARLAGIPAIITSSKRTSTEQERLVRAGLSKTLQSRHLTGRAFDVDLLGYDRDSVPRYVWDWLHQVGKKLGMKMYLTWDRGHFESDR